MSLEVQIEAARKEIASDGYEMSVGEIISLYRDGELIIHPEFQRLFRWDSSKKTRFIESLLLGIPIPPIFVFQTDKGLWELIDGLQRLSTIFEFVGILKSGGNGTKTGATMLEERNFSQNSPTRHGRQEKTVLKGSARLPSSTSRDPVFGSKF